MDESRSSERTKLRAAIRGRMGENIITNELLEAGFLVTHLDKGTRGVSANADLMVGHAKLDKPILLQVKSCDSPTLDFIFLGAGHPDFNSQEHKLYNSKPGFLADYVAFVSIKSPREYNYFVMNVELAEKVAKEHFNAWHAVPKRDGDKRKNVPKMYVITDFSRNQKSHPMMIERDHSTMTIFENHKNNAATFCWKKT